MPEAPVAELGRSRLREDDSLHDRNGAEAREIKGNDSSKEEIELQKYIPDRSFEGPNGIQMVSWNFDDGKKSSGVDRVAVVSAPLEGYLHAIGQAEKVDTRRDGLSTQKWKIILYPGEENLPDVGGYHSKVRPLVINLDEEELNSLISDVVQKLDDAGMTGKYASFYSGEVQAGSAENKIKLIQELDFTQTDLLSRLMIDLKEGSTEEREKALVFGASGLEKLELGAAEARERMLLLTGALRNLYAEAYSRDVQTENKLRMRYVDSHKLQETHEIKAILEKLGVTDIPNAEVQEQINALRAYIHVQHRLPAGQIGGTNKVRNYIETGEANEHGIEEELDFELDGEETELDEVLSLMTEPVPLALRVGDGIYADNLVALFSSKDANYAREEETQHARERLRKSYSSNRSENYIEDQIN